MTTKVASRWLESIKARGFDAAQVCHVSSERSFLYTNSAAFDVYQDHYDLQAMFTAQDGTDVSSFNYTGAVIANLELPMAELGTLDRRVRGSMK